MVRRKGHRIVRNRATDEKQNQEQVERACKVVADAMATLEQFRETVGWSGILIEEYLGYVYSIGYFDGRSHPHKGRSQKRGQSGNYPPKSKPIKATPVAMKVS